MTIFLKDLDHAYDVIKDLQGKLEVASRFCTILKCHSCDGYYAQGYVCDCGRDHSYSDEEWKEIQEERAHKNENCL